MYELGRKMGMTQNNSSGQLAYIINMMKIASKHCDLPRPPINKLKYSMLRANSRTSAPRLHVKASDARKVIRCLRFLLEEMLPLETYHQQLRYHCVRHFDEMYKHLSAGSNADHCLRAAESCQRALILCGELQTEDIEQRNFHERGYVTYKLYPKHHGLLHVVCEQIASSGTPVQSWCYADESEIGAAVKLAKTLHYSTLHSTVLRKHRLL